MLMRNNCNVNWVTGTLGFIFLFPAFVLLIIAWLITNTGQSFEQWMNWKYGK
jgi:hypothetical protein